MKKQFLSTSGQAISEMVLLIPLMLMLAAGSCAVVYMCWQGVKVQQAANLAARIQGQERVAGGVSLSMIQHDNGVDLGGDSDPGDVSKMDSDQLKSLHKALAPKGTVYSKMQQAVYGLFGVSEQSGVFVPMPHYGTVGYSDQVKVVRVWDPPNVFGLHLNPVKVSATAYGGEDTHQYGLVRWGHTSASGAGDPFWADRDPSNGNRSNLPNIGKD